MKISSILAGGALISALGMTATGCSLLHSDPATIQTKYQCTQTVHGKPERAYCIQDSNGNNFYLPYAVWRNAVIGQNEDKYEKPSYWADTAQHSPADSEVPANEHHLAHAVHDGFGRHSGTGIHFGGGR